MNRPLWARFRIMAGRALVRFCLVSVLALTPSGLLNGGAPSVHAEGLFPYSKTFAISAYYSPLPDQEKYATGSYESDIRLNGNGTNGADGTPVYPGMIAAPKTYPFGTKMDIPGVGLTAVHDRGGAIVAAGHRGEAYDRLDIWMGYGDAGLKRALGWGKRVVDVIVYGVDDSLNEQVYLEGYSAAEAFVRQVVLAPQLFDRDIWYLSSGEDVERLQTTLLGLGYFSGEITGTYGDDTKDAVYRFQLDKGLVSGPLDVGAGHTGVNTRRLLDLAVARLKEDEEASKLQRFQKGRLLLEKHPDLNKKSTLFHRDLSLGSVGDDVSRLQEELTALGLFRTSITGFYGQTTEHAVFKYQQRTGTVMERSDYGAGVFGPKTRDRLNDMLDQRVRELSYIALKREEILGANSLLVSASENGPFQSDLALGDRGPEVKQLQQLLQTLGFFKGLFLTEFYGEQTKASVIRFQLKNGLIQSGEEEGAGVLTPATRALLSDLR